MGRETLGEGRTPPLDRNAVPLHHQLVNWLFHGNSSPRENETDLPNRYQELSAQNREFGEIACRLEEQAMS